jgi:extensin-like protein
MPVGEALRDAYICDRDLRLCCCGEPANAEATTSRGDNVAQSSSRGSGKCGYTIRLPDTIETGCGRFRAAAHRGPGECAADDVVELETILLPNKAHVVVTPAAMLRCSLAEAIAQWVREDVAPRVRVFDSSLKSLDNYASYDCRGRNRVAGATLSEHGKANALDIRSLKLMNGRVVKLTDPEVSRDFRESLRRSACVRFATVLGPGSDGYHEDHIHVDLAERRNAQHLCQWDVREPDTDNVVVETPVPLPRPRPAHRS